METASFDLAIIPFADNTDPRRFMVNSIIISEFTSMISDSFRFFPIISTAIRHTAAAQIDRAPPARLNHFFRESIENSPFTSIPASRNSCFFFFSLTGMSSYSLF